MDEQSKETNNNPSTNVQGEKKVKMVAALLAIFLGSLGIHNFYLNNKKMGIIFLLLCWTGIPGIVGFVQGIMMIIMSDNAFDQKFNN